ncbi:mitochondrial 37S ribosomal protein uS4m NAM9 [Sporobolomyces salmoneus]|uniref:mitochondrial 37S ribosomal protein uS4m NAM9 n=1 Tax=Sporobolomyces salmoneus TaxID=183962 RepID=UPI00316CF7FD
MGHKAKNPTHIIKCLPRMSWSPANLYNLYQRTYGPPTADTKFTKSALTMFQQKWKAKQLVRGYHGDWIPEKKFKKGYLPNGLPPIVGNKLAGEAKVPLASMMFSEVEKRLDTVVFRCCFADSVYKARQMVIHGKVKLNGQKVTDANTKLQPGDLISVDPEAVSTLQRPKTKKPSSSPSSSDSASSEDSTDASVSAESPVPPPPAPLASSSSAAQKPLRFKLPDFAAPFLFIPPYIEPSFSTCSAVYLRHPTASPGVSEVPSPYEADGEVMRLAWEYYVARGRKVDKRPENSRGKRLGA